MHVARLLILLMALCAVRTARAEEAFFRDQFARTVYEGMEETIRREYQLAVMAVARRAGDGDTTKDKMQQAMKTLYYNKAALFAFCVADAEQARAPDAPRVPAEANPLITSCVDKKLTDLQDFTNKLNFAGIFFPERIVRCGEESRLPERERVLAPYSFLETTERRLFDFARYNECLMRSDQGP